MDYKKKVKHQRRFNACRTESILEFNAKYTKLKAVNWCSGSD